MNRYKLTRYPNSITHYRLETDPIHVFTIKKKYVNNAKASKRKIKNTVNGICQKKELNKLRTTIFQCPICNSCLITEEIPISFGDDYVCRCTSCHNVFIFGGTIYLACNNSDYKSPGELCSPDSMTDKYAIVSYCKNNILLTNEKKLIVSDEFVLIVKEQRDCFTITDLFLMSCVSELTSGSENLTFLQRLGKTLTKKFNSAKRPVRWRSGMMY